MLIWASSGRNVIFNNLSLWKNTVFFTWWCTGLSKVKAARWWTERAPPHSRPQRHILEHGSSWDVLGDRAFKEVIKVKWGHRSRAERTSVLISGRHRAPLCTCRRKATRGHSKEATIYLQARKSSLTRNQPCQHLPLDLLTFTLSEHFC